MDKATFSRIWNALKVYGAPRLSKAKTSLIVFTHIPDTSAIEATLPAGFQVSSSASRWDPEQGKMMPAMTVVFSFTELTEDEAFSEAKGAFAQVSASQ